MTVRPNTERPVTIWEGTNQLIEIDQIESEALGILDGNGKSGKRPKYWDGHSARRISEVLLNGVL